MHYTTRRFWQNYHALPQEVRQIALKYYQLPGLTQSRHL